MLSTLCTTLLLALSASDQGETADWLSKLESNAAAERGAAQTWLAANLELEDFELLHEAAALSGAEGHRRLVAVLASSERHFGLAALLGTDKREDVASVGREALLELASSWSTATEDRGVRRSKVTAQLKKRALTRFEFDPRAHKLGSVLELLTIAGGSGVMLVFDPDLLQSRTTPKLDTRTGSLLVGNQAELLTTLGRSYSFGFDGFGLEDNGDMAWIRICRRLRAGKVTGRELLVDWSLRVARNPNLREPNPTSTEAQDAQACARALAGSGWPAAIAWLEQRWLVRGDEAAFSGLRLLASRGLVSPQLRSREVQAAWLATVRAEDSLEEIARALGALGRQGSNGEDLEASLLAGWERLASWERWVRLVALESRGSSGDASRELIFSLLRGTSSNSALAYQALRTGAELNFELGETLAPERIFGLVEYAIGIDGGRELTGLLGRLAVEPSRGLSVESWDREQRLALCEWYFMTRRPEFVEAAGVLLGQLLSDFRVAESPANSILIGRLREWLRTGRSAELRQWLQNLESAQPGSQLISAHLGLLDGEAENRLAQDLIAKTVALSATAAELQTLAALTAGAKGREILDLLTVRALGDGPDSIEPALDEAVRVLRANRLDGQLESFVAKIHLAGLPATWPALPAPQALPLRLFERRFEP